MDFLQANPTPPAPAGNTGRRRRIVQHPWWSEQVQLATIDRSHDDDEATAQTIRAMHELAAADATQPTVRQAALAATSTLAPQATVLDTARAVHRWIRSKVRLQPDEAAVAGVAGLDAATTEVLMRPVDLLAQQHPAGDCDDFSMLAASMFRALGVSSAFATVAADPTDPERYSHVYVIAFDEAGQAIPVDASHGPAVPWEAPAIGKRKIWRFEGMRGLGFIEQPSATQTFPDTSGSGFNWNSVILPAEQTGLQILRNQFADKSITYQSDAKGNVIVRGATPATIPGLTTAAAGGGALWLIAGGALLLILLISRK